MYKIYHVRLKLFIYLNNLLIQFGCSDTPPTNIYHEVVIEDEQSDLCAVYHARARTDCVHTTDDQNVVSRMLASLTDRRVSEQAVEHA